MVRHHARVSRPGEGTADPRWWVSIVPTTQQALQYRRYQEAPISYPLALRTTLRARWRSDARCSRGVVLLVPAVDFPPARRDARFVHAGVPLTGGSDVRHFFA